MSERLARAIIRYRVLIILAVLTITLFFAYQMKNIRLYQNLTEIAPRNHPYVQLSSYMARVFGGYAAVQIGLVVREGDIFNVETLAKIQRIHQKLRFLKGVVPGQVISIASSKLKHIYTVTDEEGFSQIINLNLNKMVQRIVEERDPAYLRFYREALLNNDRIYGSVVSRDKKATVFLVSFWNDKDYLHIFNSLREITQAEEDANHQFYIAGRPIVMGHLYHFLKRMILFFGLAVGLIVVLLLVAFRTLRGVLIPPWAGMVTVVWGLGSEAFFGVEMDIMSVIVPFMVMAIEVSHSVQILNRYYEEYAIWQDNQKACEATIASLLPPGVASIVTDGAGFATLTLVPFRLLQQMGWSATYGVVRIFFTTLIFLPAFLAILPAPKEKEMERYRRGGQSLKALLERIAVLTYGRGRYAVVAAGLVLLLVGAWGTARVEVGDLQEGDPLFWADSEYNRAEKLLNDRFSGTNPYWIYIEGNEPRDLLDPGLVREVNALQLHLERIPQVGGSRSYADILKQTNKALHDNDPRWEVLPTDRDMVGQYIEMFISSGGPDDYRGYFEMDLREGAIQVYLKDRKGRTIEQAIHDSQRYISVTQQSCARIQPGGGLIGVFAAIIEEIRRSQLDGLLQISAVVLLFCVLTYRSLMGGLLILIPLGLGTLVTFAVMGFGQIGLFLYTLPVASLGMGLGVDYSLYVVSRLREEFRQGKGGQEAFIEALATSGRAVFYTAMAVALGVVALLTSAVRFQAVMGGMLAVIIVANMLGALVLLPALISVGKPGFNFRPSGKAEK
ncbi:MAG: MMPL family transporter [Candidatus Tectomicrobia bacterium]|uniref:MMPL family transporter n=1 Tax=Tectimicrobiota bacterium TaxID=2528274 RepID=A0A932CPH2_UNCTE|nr:MMPL family transporter [Candidatus Tectomicrobia bacterium]